VETAFERVWQQALSASYDMDVEVDDEDIPQLAPAAALQHLQNGTARVGHPSHEPVLSELVPPDPAALRSVLDCSLPRS
jgi:hypothetical protein